MKIFKIILLSIAISFFSSLSFAESPALSFNAQGKLFSVNKLTAVLMGNVIHVTANLDNKQSIDFKIDISKLKGTLPQTLIPGNKKSDSLSGMSWYPQVGIASLYLNKVGVGKITVNSFEPSKQNIAGTFNLVLEKSDNSNDIINVSQGNFNIQYMSMN